ncbi:MAG: phage tail sheath C-terminal domain-containing protein, partial [Variovorax sp.]
AGGVDSAHLANADYLGSASLKTGIFALDKADLFNLMCIPPDTRGGDTAAAVYQAAMAYCATRRAVLLVDPLAAWGQVKETAAAKASDPSTGVASLGLTGDAARNAAIFFPRVIKSDPQLNGQPDVFAPCGVVAGIIARTDGTRGVWKAPAGLDAALNGVQGLQANLSDGDNGVLNPLGINCLRYLSGRGYRVYGARTASSDPEWKYVNVRRYFNYLEASIDRGTQWAVFEPNNERLWANIRETVESFLYPEWLSGALLGSNQQEAYFVRCDRT